MSDVPTAPAPPTPSAAPRRGIEELRPRIVATWDVVDLAKFEKFLAFRPEKP
jgi:hypothetical protein